MFDLQYFLFDDKKYGVAFRLATKRHCSPFLFSDNKPVSLFLMPVMRPSFKFALFSAVCSSSRIAPKSFKLFNSEIPRLASSKQINDTNLIRISIEILNYKRD